MHPANENIAKSILLVRGQKVLLDRDLAAIYGVTTGRLNQLLNAISARSQFAISSRGGRRYRPYVFTDYGTIQSANVLNSPQAVEIGIYVVRAFVQLRDAGFQ